MTNPMTFFTLQLLLLLYCPGNRLVGELAAVTADNLEGDRASSSAKTSRSSCQPLSNFIGCYDVVVPIFTQGSNDSYRRVELPVTIKALGRQFNLRLRVDTLVGDAKASKSHMSWSWVISPSVKVHVRGEDEVHEYGKDELGIKWYVGFDDHEVAPSAVLASVVDFNGQNLFRAVIHTTEDIYYVDPATDYPEVVLYFSKCLLFVRRVGLGLVYRVGVSFR